MDLIEHDAHAAVVRRLAAERPKEPRRHADLLVAHDRAVNVARQPLLTILEGVVENDPGPEHCPGDVETGRAAVVG